MNQTNPTNPSSSSSSLRVLTRPTTPQPILSSNPGAVVVGFVSWNSDQSSQLINRVLDSNVFGSGNLEKPFFVEKEEVKDWFNWRRISYYYEEEKGVVFLQFCGTCCPVLDGVSGSSFDAAVEEIENEDLKGLLFMFSVCHIILYIQEGSSFDTDILEKFKVLQTAKNSLVPHIKSRTALPMIARPQSSSSSSKSTILKSTSPVRRVGIFNRNASAVTPMPGLGSHISFFPGHCTPVALFVFIDNFLDGTNPSSNAEELTDASSVNQSSSLNNLARQNLPTKTSGSVVVLARPVSKSEGGTRKQLQSSLESQIRFLIKKSRILSGSETGHSGSRSGGVSSSAPLFLLDATRAVVLLDRSTNQKGESLEFATLLVDDVLNGKSSSDSLLLETHGQSANKEDITAIKEFIYRQSDILRGRGGTVSSSNNGLAGGVGMVAVAAAAAAASAASGKTITTPDLPSMETWLSSTQHILDTVLSAKHGSLFEAEVIKRKPRQQTSAAAQVEGVASRGTDANTMDVSASSTVSGRGVSTKFSTLWCEKAFPTAKDVYLKDLPAFYPTSQHEAHLKKALDAFRSMVKGPAVELFAKKLEDECTSIWNSGRQLCDAVSLTGKPCMYQRHDVKNVEPLAGTEVKQHSSGYFFLHTCACGRSRQLRPDPFDFESANMTSNIFPECDKSLPSIQLPETSHGRPVQTSSWSLIRVGGARYYDPSKGLLLTGFSATHRFLFKWTIFLERPTNDTGLTASIVNQCSVSRTKTNTDVELNSGVDKKKADHTRLHSEDMQNGGQNQTKLAEENKLVDKKINFGRGHSTFAMRRPFSEVVAGSSTTDSGFPPLQQRNQLSSVSEKGNKQNKARGQHVGQIRATANQGSKQRGDILSVQENKSNICSNGSIDGDPILQVGSNVVPMNIGNTGMGRSKATLKHVTVYVGFEHECSHGHRFLLNLDHLNELGSAYSLSNGSQTSAMETSDLHTTDAANMGGNGGSGGKIQQNLKGITVSAPNKLRNKDKSKEFGRNGNGLIHVSGLGKEQIQSFNSFQAYAEQVKKSDMDFHPVNLDDSGRAFSILNRNLPVFMNCPYCGSSKNKKDARKINFAATVSQLQRIYVVTPTFPVVLAMCPVIQFEASCLPQSVADRERKLQFSPGCQVVLPPESFLTLKLPFVYGVQLEDGHVQPLNAFEHQPEMTAWIVKGTTLQIISKGCNIHEGQKTQVKPS